MTIRNITNLPTRSKLLMTFLAFVLTFSVGCQREDLSSLGGTNDPAILHNPAPVDSRDVVLQNDRLVFQSKAHFQEVIYYLGDLDDERFPEWSQLLGHQSLLTDYIAQFGTRNNGFPGFMEDYQGIGDELLGTLINKDGLVQIASWAYLIDMPNASVYVFDGTISNTDAVEFASRNSAGIVATFSIDDEILELLDESGGNMELAARSSTSGKSGCRRENEWDHVPPFYNYLRYIKAGLYFTAYAKIKKTQNVSNRIHASCAGYVTPNKRSSRFVTDSQSRNGKSATGRAYSNTRKLVDFDLNGRLTVRNAQNQNTMDVRMDIQCR